MSDVLAQAFLNVLSALGGAAAGIVIGWGAARLVRCPWCRRAL